MGQLQNTQHVRQYRANPIELVIFLIIGTVFVNSCYNLFYQHPAFHTNALTPMASNPLSEGRAPASVAQNLMNLDLTCDQTADATTDANKIRVLGPLCGTNTKIDGTQLLHSQISNTANQFNATVFTDIANGKFSTDYLPLIAGKNTIHVEFKYGNGATFSQDILVTKN
jgi:hypothetical protein